MTIAYPLWGQTSQLLTIPNQDSLDNAQAVYTINQLFDENFIGPTYQYGLLDTQQNLTIEAVQQLSFSPIATLREQAAKTNGSTYWTKIRLHNQLEVKQTYWLSVLASKSYGYLIHADGSRTISQTGAIMPHKEKTIQTIKRRLANFLLIELNSGEQATLYIKNVFRGGASLSGRNKLQTPLNGQLDQLINRGFENFFNGSFQSILLLLTLYCFFYALYSREWFAFYLGVYCLIYCIFFLNTDGYLYAITEVKNQPVLFDLMQLNLINFAILFEALFIQGYLSLKKQLPFWNRIFNGMNICAIGVSIYASLYYLSTDNFTFPFYTSSLFHLIWNIIRPFFLIRVWFMRDTRIRILLIGLILSYLLAAYALYVYIFLVQIANMYIKISIGLYTTFAMISLSYFAAKARVKNLNYEKESIQKQLVLAQETNKALAIKQKNELLEIKNKNLQKNNQLKSRFFANVSHELRTPLTLILSPIQSILKSSELSHRNETWLRLAQKNGQRLLQMTNEILDLNKLEAGKLTAQYKRVVLLNFLKRTIANFQSNAEQANIELLLAYELRKDLLLKLDRKKMETILVNLLSNALKFTPPGGQIIVQVNQHQKFLQIRVKDTGRGIPADDLPHIFDRYFQTKDTTRIAEGGTGIGLALSKELAALIDGQLRVKSEWGKGTTFTLEVPMLEIIGRLSDEEAHRLPQNLSKQNEEVTKEEEKMVLDAAATSTPAILIVEDNMDLRQYLQSILSEKYQVHTAENGQVALAELAKIPIPNLIISDIMMPTMDGYQLLAHLKTNKQFQLIPVIMLTALAQSDHKLKALRIGVDDYILKPFVAEELLARIANLLKHATLRQQFITTEIQAITVSEATNGVDSIAETNKKITPSELEWLQNLENVTLKKLGNFNFSIEQLASEMAQSRWQLNRKLKALMGLTARQYLLETRLNQARRFLENSTYDSKAVTYNVGIKDLKHFSNQFKNRFGKRPSAYLNH